MLKTIEFIIVSLIIYLLMPEKNVSLGVILVWGFFWYFIYGIVRESIVKYIEFKRIDPDPLDKVEADDYRKVSMVQDKIINKYNIVEVAPEYIGTFMDVQIPAWIKLSNDKTYLFEQAIPNIDTFSLTELHSKIKFKEYFIYNPPGILYVNPDTELKNNEIDSRT